MYNPLLGFIQELKMHKWGSNMICEGDELIIIESQNGADRSIQHHII